MPPYRFKNMIVEKNKTIVRREIILSFNMYFTYISSFFFNLIPISTWLIELDLFFSGEPSVNIYFSYIM